MKVFYIADTHFGHENILKLCNRPFKDIEEMNRQLILNWNSRVTDNDLVYIVGDFSFRGNEDRTLSILKSLKGKKVLIVGNHDNKNLKSSDFRKYFIEITPMKTIFDNSVGEKVVLCHYPIIEWEGYFRGSYLVYGHIHNNVTNNAYKCMKDIDKALNAGVDINYFMPVTLPELIQNNLEFKSKNV